MTRPPRFNSEVERLMLATRKYEFQFRELRDTPTSVLSTFVGIFFVTLKVIRNVLTRAGILENDELRRAGAEPKMLFANFLSTHYFCSIVHRIQTSKQRELGIENGVT